MQKMDHNITLHHLNKKMLDNFQALEQNWQENILIEKQYLLSTIFITITLLYRNIDILYYKYMEKYLLFFIINFSSIKPSR